MKMLEKRKYRVHNACAHVSKLLVLMDKCLHCSQEPRYRYTSGSGQPSEHAVLQVTADHETGATVAERGEESTRITASDLQRLQVHYRRIAGVYTLIVI